MSHIMPEHARLVHLQRAQLTRECSRLPYTLPSLRILRRRIAAGASLRAASSGVSEEFMAWAEAAGIQAPKVAQAEFEGGLRGYRAVEDIPPFEELISVPRSAALVVMPNQRRPSNSVGAQYWEATPWFVKMALLLLEERRKGRRSRLWGYIQQLPQSVDLPVRWGEAELAQLQDQPAIQEVLVQQQQWRELYAELSAALAAEGGPAVSWEEYLWAMENVCSRVFTEGYRGPSLQERLTWGGAATAAAALLVLWQDMPPLLALNGALAAWAASLILDVALAQLKLRMYALLPVVDGANHLTSMQTQMAYNPLADAFTVRASVGFQRGQQVFINYGPSDNDSLLMYYGFVEPGNPLDTYGLEMAAGGQSVLVTVNADGDIDEEGLAALRAALPAGRQQQQQGQGQEEDASLWQAVAEACQAALAQLPTSAAEDEQLLQQPQQLPSRTRLAVQFRLEKKRLLQRCLEAARARGGLPAGAERHEVAAAAAVGAC